MFDHAGAKSGLKPKGIAKPEVKGKVSGEQGESHAAAEPSGVSTTLHDHGDGTFHSEGHDGETTEHPNIGHAVVHIASKHAEGKHMHTHHDGGSLKSHTHDGMSEPEEHEHGSGEEVGQHAAQFFGESDGEHQQQPEEENESVGGFRG
jgi:hypothetical protein